MVDKILSMLALHRNTFPALELLVWTPILQHAEIVHLLPPCLKELRISKPLRPSTPLPWTSPIVDSLMQVLPLKCPGLKRLDIHKDAPFTPTIGSATLALRYLETLAIVLGKQAFSIIAPLAAMGTLRELVLQMHEIDIVPSNTPVIFGGLLSLAVRGSKGVVVQVLNGLRCPDLKVISIAPWRDVTQDCTNPVLINAITSCIGPQTTCVSIAVQPQITESVDLCDFHPLRKFAGLRMVALSTVVNPTDDQLVQTLADWPLLDTFGLSVFRPTAVSLSLQGVLTAANKCPNLECLDISFDGRIIPTATVHSEAPRLKPLNLYPRALLPIEDPMAVAHYLHAYGDKVILHKPIGEGEFDQRWREAGELLERLQLDQQ